MSEPGECPSCGESLEIRPVDTACPDCVGRFESWSDRVARLVAGRGGGGPGGADGGPDPVLFQSRQHWFNAGLTVEQAAERELALLADLARPTADDPLAGG